MQHALLRQSIDWDTQTLTVTPPSPSDEPFAVPLSPSTASLAARKVDLHGSPTLAYDCGDDAAAFFTRHSEGTETRLMYLEEGVSANRKVLGSIALGADESIAFQDCASYMIASSASLAAFSRALGRNMPVLPLRPNIVVGGPRLRPWVEDFWQELRVAGKTTFRITSNCVRCISLNIDYDTGKRLEGKGLPLQTLAKDRRVDPGSFSPVFVGPSVRRRRPRPARRANVPSPVLIGTLRLLQGRRSRRLGRGQGGGHGSVQAADDVQLAWHVTQTRVAVLRWSESVPGSNAGGLRARDLVLRSAAGPSRTGDPRGSNHCQSVQMHS
ncbi:hypothetical protein DMC30DRAFT_271524 [Rhodotorula diobovata]|uniref:MOSC domain-containing protein n=1 Tax=Rhodotorula diobovata TaxID=5288 RepID=A0A5C5FUS8_9BASI|nr:hypothetical protein DMC30DRAFT_271524 [Rhodotorula diobovata]